jgi:outer membrane usher protein
VNHIPHILFVLTLLAGVAYLPVIRAEPVGSAPSTAVTGIEENLWSVTLNGKNQNETVIFLRKTGGKVFAAAKDLQRWRLRLPTVPPLTHQNEDFYALDDLGGTYRVDDATQSIAIEVSGDQFMSSSVSGRSESPTAVPSSLGGFLNYDAAISYSQKQMTLNALTELGVFNSWGVGTTTFLGQNLSEAARIKRLDSTWVTDMPDSMSSLRFGDISSQSGEWGGAARFGGVQWATNFATQSRFIAFPMPAVAGEAALPSTVDVYVNNLLQMHTDVPAGPFTINNLPVMTGQGDARIVVRDLLGREQVISQPYYVSPQLLSEGTQQFSYETGLIRNNYGIQSFDYGRAFATATHRYGFTNELTGEAHGEFLKQQQILGGSASYLWSDIGVLNLALAGSHSDFGFSPFVGAGFQHQNKWFSISAHTRLAGKHFTQIGIQPETLAPRQISNASTSINFGSYGSVNVGYLRQDNRDKADRAIVNAGYNVSVGNIGTLNIGYFRSLKGLPDDTVALTFTFSLGDILGESTSASIGATALQQNEQATLQIQRNLPRGNGFGYRVLASDGLAKESTKKFGASITAQNDVGLYNAEVTRFGEQTAFRGGLSGGVAMMGTLPHFSRRLTDSFALVNVPNTPNVRVYADNQLAGITNEDGDVLIPRLRPYQRNPIRIEQADLPFDAQFNNLEMDAVPYFRSGYELNFAIKRSRSAVFTMLLSDGKPLPSGALVQVIGGKEEFPVALRGEVFMTDLQNDNHLRATWRGQSCEFVVAFPETQEPLPNLGTFTCLGVST